MTTNQTSTTATAPTTAANEILDLRHLLRSAAGRDATKRRMIEEQIAKLESQASTATAPTTAVNNHDALIAAAQKVLDSNPGNYPAIEELRAAIAAATA